MAARIIVGVIALIAIIGGFTELDDTQPVLVLLLVIGGLIYGGMSVDAEDATGHLAVVIAVGLAAGANVLSQEVLSTFGESLDGIVDHVATALYASVLTIIAKRTINCLKG